MLLTACLVGKSVQWGFLQEAKPSLPLFPLLRPPENLKERWNMMLFSWDGSGTETIHCFRTAEPTHHYTRKRISLHSGSLSSSPSFSNFYSRKWMGQNTSRNYFCLGIEWDVEKSRGNCHSCAWSEAEDLLQMQKQQMCSGHKGQISLGIEELS